MKCKTKSHRAGFTLIEVLAALAILSIALVVLIKGQTQSLSSVTRIGNYERAVFITENNLHWTLIDMKHIEDWEELADLTVEDGDFICNVRVEPADFEDSGDMEATLLRIVATTTWPEGRKGGFFQLETWFLWGKQK